MDEFKFSSHPIFENLQLIGSNIVFWKLNLLAVYSEDALIGGNTYFFIGEESRIQVYKYPYFNKPWKTLQTSALNHNVIDILFIFFI